MIRRIPPNFTWSFSKLQTYDQCKLAFCLEYLCGLEEKDKQQNAYADFGTLCHSILEDHVTYGLTGEQMLKGFEKRYPLEVTHPWPPFPKTAEANYIKGAVDYFTNFESISPHLDILCAEDPFIIEDLFSAPFKGVVDLTAIDKRDGALVIIDHKSKSVKTLKKDYDALKRQLYIYAAYTKQKYGEFPKRLYFNCFRDGEMVGEDFDPAFYEATIAWANDIIDNAVFDDEWNPLESSNNYFCKFICGVRNYCDGTIMLIEEENNE